MDQIHTQYHKIYLKICPKTVIRHVSKISISVAPLFGHGRSTERRYKWGMTSRWCCRHIVQCDVGPTSASQTSFSSCRPPPGANIL